MSVGRVFSEPFTIRDRLHRRIDREAAKRRGLSVLRRGGSVECRDPADHTPGPASGGAVDERVAAWRACGCPRGCGEGQPILFSGGGGKPPVYAIGYV